MCSLPGELAQAISGALLSTTLLISREIGRMNSRISSRVMTNTASERRPHSSFCSLSSSGQVAITTMPAQAKPRINGWITQKQATIMMAINNTPKIIRGKS